MPWKRNSLAASASRRTRKETPGWCPKNGVPLKGSGTAATRLKSKKKAFETASFEKKKFDGASTRFETKKWDGIKSFTDDKLETPDFIARARGVNTHSWQDASKQYATQQSDFHGRSWKDADKRLGRTVNRDIEAKRQSFGQPTIMSARQAQAHTIQETREMMGRTD